MYIHILCSKRGGLSAAPATFGEDHAHRLPSDHYVLISDNSDNKQNNI